MSSSTISLANQFGEKTKNFIIGGTSQDYCNFVVDSTNGNGLGIRTLKGQGVANVYMHTSATPAVGSPNPVAGYIYVQMTRPHQGYFSGFSGFASAASGTPINVTTGLSVGLAYIITALGTTSLASWQALGLPVGITPALGASFIAITASAGSGTGAVQLPLATGSGVSGIDIVGDPNTTCNPSTGGSYIILRCLAPTNSSTTTPVIKAPADGTVIGLNFIFASVTGAQSI